MNKLNDKVCIVNLMIKTISSNKHISKLAVHTFISKLAMPTSLLLFLFIFIFLHITKGMLAKAYQQISNACDIMQL